MSQYGLITLAGIAASWHCAAMCGGFACALSPGQRGGAAARRQLLYNAGRVTTYCFLGALAGALTAGICKASPGALPLEGAQRVLAVVSGLLILLIGAQFLGLVPRAARAPMVGFGAQALANALRSLQRAPGLAAPLAFGVANGFLPCPLVYGVLAQAAASGDAAGGMAVMAAFGLGTFPAMLAMGGLGGWLGLRLALAPLWRQRAGIAAGLFLLLLGAVTLARGVLPMASHGAMT
jgi:uncharacterized protein